MRFTRKIAKTTSSHRTVTQTITALALFVMLLAGFVQAQYSSSIIKVNVPFEFSVGNKAFSAGSYSVVRTAPYILALRDAHNAVLATIITSSVQAATARAVPRLVFSTQGGQYALIRVWFAGRSWGNELPQAKRRTTLANVQPGKIEVPGQP